MVRNVQSSLWPDMEPLGCQFSLSLYWMNPSKYIPEKQQWPILIPSCSKKKVLESMSEEGGAEPVWAWSVVSPPGTRWRWRETPPRHHKKTKQQSITACLTCTSLSPFFPLFSLHSSPPPFHHPITPSHTPPSVALSVFLFPPRAAGLLFMASPVEDALLYKTLEPSSRPTPFEDVAHNSYLGL